MYETKATQNQIAKMHSHILNGMTVDESLILCDIERSDYKIWMRAYYVSEIAKGMVEIEEVPPIYRPNAHEIEEYKTDKAYKHECNVTANIVYEIEKDKLRFKSKLLEQINSANEKNTSNWTAYRWLLEQFYPESFKNDDKDTSKDKSDIKVEFISNDSQSDRLKSMEKQVDKEINGVEKA